MECCSAKSQLGREVDVHVLGFVTIRFDNFICINVHIIQRITMCPHNVHIIDVSCSMECIF